MRRPLTLLLLLAALALLLLPISALLAQPPAPACAACKVVIDYGALQAAAADLEKSAYAQWETVLAGLESGAFTEREALAEADAACKLAEEIRAKTELLEYRLREMSLRAKPKPGKK